MQTYVLLVEYDGTDYCGWQRQENGPTVQEAIETALATALRVPRIPVVGSGRTDAGVHARGQVAHFVTDGPLDTRQLQQSLNGLLPQSVAIQKLAEGPDGFHARYDAVGRLYHYYLSTAPVALERGHRVHVKSPPDFAKMNEAATHVWGTHHFGAFCITKSSTVNRVCTVSRAKWVPEGKPGNWRFEIEADRFLHGMVRAVVGTLLLIGRGLKGPEDMPRILASRDRQAAGPAVPARGLVLERVSYRAPIFGQAEVDP